MKATKAGLKRFFENNHETQFIYKTITRYFDNENNNLIVEFENDSEPQERKLKQVTPSYIRFYGSNLEISPRLNVDEITEEHAIVSYPDLEINLSNVEHEGKLYSSVTKKVKKIITYKKG